MTAGRGIRHSEVSTASTDVLHGAKLWVALRDAARNTEPGFQHHAPSPVRGPGWEARVFLGSALGETSPVSTHTPLLGAEIMLAPGASIEIDVEAAFEHGVLVDTGLVGIADSADGAVTETKPGELAYVGTGRDRLRLTAYDEARVLLLGGEPLGESIVMWWNFVGRTHEEIVAFREEWQAQVAGAKDGQDVRPGRFGIVTGEHLPPIPAPALPNARLKERR
jgi:redox-sensitive bicupin YhaK (pirin superfamily)